MKQGLRLEIIWFDEDILELRVQASNGRFSATANVYTGLDGLSSLANAFRAFPASLDDQRDLEVGTFDAGYAGGGLRLQLRCVDRAGHIVLRLSIREASQQNGEFTEDATFEMPTEASLIDDFLQQLDGITVVKVGLAVQLRMA